jgi:predicted nucleic acid-binding protein
MYVETDFILALLKNDDWLSKKAEKIYKQNEKLWTSHYTLIEIMMVAYREDRNVLSSVAETIELVEVRGNEKEVESAAVYVEEEEMTPFDALHLVKSGSDTIVSSDKDYEKYSDTVDLKNIEV